MARFDCQFQYDIFSGTARVTYLRVEIYYRKFSGIFCCKRRHII